MKSHRTSGSPEESVGRWRKPLSAAHQAHFQEVMGDLLRSFGYETDRPVAA
jgi:hypothetical protein